MFQSNMSATVAYNIEMAFGKLMHGWAILRKPLNVNSGLSKMMALVLTLCHLHNFCIAEALLQNDTSTDTNDSTIELLAMDNANVVCDGGISLQDNERPTPLMDGSDHLEDVAPYE